MKKNRKYTEEYKIHCVSVLEKSKDTETVAEVAARLKVNKSTLYGWYRAYSLRDTNSEGKMVKGTKGDSVLLRENKLLRKECELLRELNSVLLMR